MNPAVLFRNFRAWSVSVFLFRSGQVRDRAAGQDFWRAGVPDGESMAGVVEAAEREGGSLASGHGEQPPRNVPDDWFQVGWFHEVESLETRKRVYSIPPGEPFRDFCDRLVIVRSRHSPLAPHGSSRLLVLNPIPHPLPLMDVCFACLIRFQRASVHQREGVGAPQWLVGLGPCDANFGRRGSRS